VVKQLDQYGGPARGASPMRFIRPEKIIAATVNIAQYSAFTQKTIGTRSTSPQKNNLEPGHRERAKEARYA
jgi:hypothetical protein